MLSKVLLTLVVTCLLVMTGLAIYESYRSYQTSQGETGDVEQEETA